jgi:parallel beta-helix repeat protein
MSREGGLRLGARAGAISVVLALSLASFAASASAATIEVRPGANAINKALDKADNGDLLRVHDGTYREAFTVDKRVRIRGVGGRPLIDARCESRTTIEVVRGGVKLAHLKVVGAAEHRSGLFPSEIDVQNVGSGIIEDVVVHDPCGGIDKGAEYGINVFNSGHVEVIDNRAIGGFHDAGIYIGGITDTGDGTLRVVSNASYRNHQGIIIENSSGPGSRIRVAKNNVHHNTIPGEIHEDTGIFINNSDRVRLRDNSVRRNGHFGINITSGSDDNALIDNVIRNNPVDINNDGTGTCGSGNSFGSLDGAPLSPCR